MIDQKFIQTKLTHQMRKAECSGNPAITNNKCINSTLADYKVYGNSKQEAEPTPDNPCEIKSVGDLSSNLYIMTSNNIIAANNATITKNIENQEVSIQNDTSKWGSARLLYQLEKGKTYTLSAKIKELNSSTGAQLWVFGNFFENGRERTSKLGKVGDTLTLTFTVDKDYKMNTWAGSMGLYPLGVENEKASATFSEITLVEGSPKNPYILPISIKSKNLFNINETQIDNPKGKYYQPIVTVDGTTLKLQARNANAIQCAYFHCDVGVGRKVTLRVSGLMGANAATSNSRVRYKFTDSITNIGGGEVTGTPLSNLPFSQTEEKTYSVTTTSTARYMLVCMSVQLTGSDLSNAIAYYSNIQVEYGTVATDYEEYKEPETRPIYLSEPLRAIGDYKDHIDFKSGKVIRNIRQSYPAAITGVEGNYNFYISLEKLARPKTYICLCSHFQHKQASAQQNIYNCFIGATGKYFNFQNPDIEHTVSAGNTFLKEKQPILNYVLATPIEEMIDLPKLPQFKGTTIYTVDTETDGEFWCKYKYKK